ncbi:MTOR-associated protein MEAK7 [Gouania willdenowi]|uniref:MTOR-associated protein MEAK7 n=1 Tax=Gouania willdenowi TaxID=441366 RepID=A0A8C5D3E1_GOUWI|nr:TLD domain-containing protein 1 [Gouania willdenowi]XP_028306658.1 TLD domain-containing protein 1 [Gouania willdenowi]
MGNTESVIAQKRLERFRPEERPVIKGVFDRLLSGAGGPTAAGKTLTLDIVQAVMGNVAAESMVKRLYGGMCSIDAGLSAPTDESVVSSGVSREQLLIFLADTLRGTAEERAPLVIAMSQHAVGPKAVTCEQVVEFLQDLIPAVVQILVHRGRLQGWQPDKMGDISVGVKLLADQLCSELKASDDGLCDVLCVEDWIFRVPQVSLYLEMLVAEGLNVTLSGRPATTLLPPCRKTPWDNVRGLLLDLPTLMFLAPQLPDGYSAPWRLEFSTQLHGESFTRMLTGLMHRGPTLLLIKDTKGHVFGGFASHSWEVKPQFQGDSRCFLFSVFPQLRVYTTTGYNQHFMYLNQNQQTMPNGLGMGGQHDYFGLWLDCDFGRGHSRAHPKCTTYGSPQLSAEEDFVLDSVEVWAVGKPPEPEEGEEGKRSILDADLEVQAIMEMTGKTLHSQGLREPEDD